MNRMQKIFGGIFVALGFVGCLALAQDVHAQVPAQWNYGINPSTGNAQATYPGDVRMSEMGGGGGGCLQVDGSGNLSSTASGACGQGVAVIGTPVAGELTQFAGVSTPANQLTNGNLSGDCTTSNTLAVICLKTNGVSFGTAATRNTGSSGAAIPLLNATNTWSARQTFTASALTIHFGSSANLPTVGSCGTGAAFATNSSDLAGVLVAGATTTCTFNWNTAYGSAPFCIVQDQTSPAVSIGVTTTTTGITLSTNGIAANDRIGYSCIGS